MLPAGIAVLGVAPLSSTGFVSQVGNTMLALMWLPITIAGYRMARQRRFAEHREWMIRSFALTTSIVVNRLWLIVLIIVLSPQVDTTFGGDQEAMITAAASAKRLAELGGQSAGRGVVVTARAGGPPPGGSWAQVRAQFWI